MTTYRAEHNGEVMLVHCARDLSADELAGYLGAQPNDITIAEAHMDEWTEEQWRLAERQYPSKTYIAPVMPPWYRDQRVWTAVWCLVLALVPLLGLWSIWPEPPQGTLPANLFTEIRPGGAL